MGLLYWHIYIYIYIYCYFEQVSLDIQQLAHLKLFDEIELMSCNEFKTNARSNIFEKSDGFSCIQWGV